MHVYFEIQSPKKFTILRSKYGNSLIKSISLQWFWAANHTHIKCQIEAINIRIQSDMHVVINIIIYYVNKLINLCSNVELIMIECWYLCLINTSPKLTTTTKTFSLIDPLTTQKVRNVTPWDGCGGCRDFAMSKILEERKDRIGFV